jgi:hypothetical protein
MRIGFEGKPCARGAWAGKIAAQSSAQKARLVERLIAVTSKS